MKTVLRIFGIIIILISLITCSMSIYRANLDKNDLTENQAELAETQEKLTLLKEEVKNMTGESKIEMDKQITEMEELLNSIPAASTYTIVAALLVILLLLSLAFGVFLFRTNLKYSNAFFWLAVFLTIIVFFVSPDIKRGEYGGLPSRTLALLSGIPVVIAGLFAIVIAKRDTQKQ
jgi:hypothetical protein